MSTLDASIMNIAVDTLIQEFQSDLPAAKWVIVGYFLALTGLLLPLGRLSDLLGRKTIFISGFMTFTVGSLLCAMAGSLPALILFRVLQATGGAMLMANGPAIITAVFPVKERGRALGTLAMVVSLGLISGPAIGGYLMELLGWRSVFFINLPLGVAGALLVKSSLAADSVAGTRRTFDVVGSILQLVALTFLALTFDVGQTLEHLLGMQQGGRWILGGLALFFVVLFLTYERRVKFPVFDVTLFREGTFSFSNLAAFAIFNAYAGLIVLLPYFLQHELQFSPKHAGALMATIPVVAFFTAPVSGLISDRRGSRELTVLGCALMTTMLLALALSFRTWEPTHWAEMRVALLLGLIGLAMAMFQTPNNNALMSAVPSAKLSTASAIVATIRNMGIVIGTGLSTNIFSWRFEVSGTGSLSLQWTLIVLAGFSFAATIASLRNRRGPLEI